MAGEEMQGLVGIEALVTELRQRDDQRADRERAIVKLLSANLQQQQETNKLLGEIKAAGAQQMELARESIQELQKTQEAIEQATKEDAEDN